MANWGMRSRGDKAPSRGQRSSADDGSPTAGTWQQSRSGRSGVTPEAIAKRAYEKWQRRGSQNGDDQRDWFEAERELWAEAGRSRN